VTDKAEACRQHLEHSVAWKGERQGILEMRMHYANYFKGIPDFKEYRTKLVTILEYPALLDVLEEIRETYAETAAV
jgi:tRNA-dihydrouridine synthase